MSDTDMVTIYTDAPSAYDYGYVVPVCTPNNSTIKGLRIVSIPRASVDYQVGRYRSGMHIACTSEEFARYFA